jgi:hypothetical protein
VGEGIYSEILWRIARARKANAIPNPQIQANVVEAMERASRAVLKARSLSESAIAPRRIDPPGLAFSREWLLPRGFERIALILEQSLERRSAGQTRDRSARPQNRGLRGLLPLSLYLLGRDYNDLGIHRAGKRDGRFNRIRFYAYGRHRSSMTHRSDRANSTPRRKPCYWDTFLYHEFRFRDRRLLRM